MRVNDSGCGGVQGRSALERRLERLCSGTIKSLELDAVRARSRLDATELCDLRLGGGDDQLAAAAVLDLFALTEGVEPLATGDAQACLEGARRIVDARVNDLARARAHRGSEALGCLEQPCLAAFGGEL